MLSLHPVRVEVQLPGGLGNQLFALAAGIYVSKTLSVGLTLDSKNIDYSHAGPDLDLRDLLEINDLHFIKSKNLPLFVNRVRDSLLYRIPGLRKCYHRIFGVIDEQSIRLGEKPSFFLDRSLNSSQHRNLRLRGYFQDLAIVESVKTQILSRIKEEFSPAGEALFHELREKRILGVHVRGGDFLDTKWRDLVGNLTFQYYLGAISVAASSLDFEEIWVFTNDLKYAESMFLGSDFQVRFLCQSEISRPAENFNLLRMCTGIVVSNSSFSYLAAFLSEHAKVVVAPAYFSKAKNSINGAPKSWHHLEPEWV